MVILYPNPILRQVSAEVSFPADILLIIETMFKVLYEYKGVGLSAIQIGIPLRLIVADVGEGREIYINPKIQRIGGVKKTLDEGCLSFPGVWEKVERFHKLTISYQDISGNVKTCNTSGLRAQMLQHEIEHLDGILLCD